MSGQKPDSNKRTNQNKYGTTARPIGKDKITQEYTLILKNHTSRAGLDAGLQNNKDNCQSRQVTMKESLSESGKKD